MNDAPTIHRDATAAALAADSQIPETLGRNSTYSPSFFQGLAIALFDGVEW